MSRHRRHWRETVLPLVGLPLLSGLFAFWLALSPSSDFDAARAQTADAPSPARGHAQVIAQGVVEMPSGDVAWRAIARTAVPAPETDSLNGTIGFVLADEAAILLTDDESADRSLLGPGEAALIRSAAAYGVTSVGSDDIPYYVLDLVPTRNAGEVGEGEVLFASMAFPAPDGNRDLNLVRDVLTADEEGALASAEAPLLILVTAGEIEVLIGESSQGITLAVGDASSFAGNLTLRVNGDEKFFRPHKAFGRERCRTATG